MIDLLNWIVAEVSPVLQKTVILYPHFRNQAYGMKLVCSWVFHKGA